ncbi:YpbF family protein [Niallia sp. Krafla_26]|uniref:YpbF family protein n=1 Tax=Niallia sp. Krafla_26 TaxID=3064703 RepID=UPI003D162737
MESPIMMLDEKTDQATRKMLQKVVERKRKFDKLTFWHLIIMWSAILVSFGYFLYLYYNIFQPYSYSFATVFSVYIQDSKHLYMLMVVIGLFGLMNVYRQKRDKAEKEFHLLRCEIIDKSKDLWSKEDEWKNRHIVFEMMKKNYDINLYHENK